MRRERDICHCRSGHHEGSQAARFFHVACLIVALSSCTEATCPTGTKEVSGHCVAAAGNSAVGADESAGTGGVTTPADGGTTTQSSVADDSTASADAGKQALPSGGSGASESPTPAGSKPSGSSAQPVGGMSASNPNQTAGSSAGSLTCPRDAKPCNDTCIPSSGCCGAADCPSGASCNDGSCECPAGQHLCGDRCESDTSTEACGPSCESCNSPSGGRVACNAGQCQASCADGKKLCAGACIDESSACNGMCPAGTHDCSGMCVDDASAATCGSSCSPCNVPPGGRATCTAGKCDFTCNAGYKQCDNSCGRQCCTSSDCPSNNACQDGTCKCTPQCAGNRCGPDGCGGICPTTCARSETCNSSGRCECVPQCGECGRDPVCGTSCPNKCGAQEMCSGTTCIAKPCGDGLWAFAAGEQCDPGSGEWSNAPPGLCDPTTCKVNDVIFARSCNVGDYCWTGSLYFCSPLHNCTANCGGGASACGTAGGRAQCLSFTTTDANGGTLTTQNCALPCGSDSDCTRTAPGMLCRDFGGQRVCGY
jgi:hypothetical protein